MDPDQNHNEGASSLQRSDRVWEHLNVSYFPSPPQPVEILAPVQIPQPPTQVNAPIFHIEPQTINPPLGSKIKILINELVHVDPLVCFNTLSLMNVLDQSLYGLANADDDTEVRVTFRNGMDPVFKKVFLDTAQKVGLMRYWIKCPSSEEKQACRKLHSIQDLEELRTHMVIQFYGGNPTHYVEDLFLETGELNPNALEHIYWINRSKYMDLSSHVRQYLFKPTCFSL